VHLAVKRRVSEKGVWDVLNTVLLAHKYVSRLHMCFHMQKKPKHFYLENLGFSSPVRFSAILLLYNDSRQAVHTSALSSII